MTAFLVAHEGLNAGLVIRLEESEEWIIGRDPDVSYHVLEDPMVSRKHVVIRLGEEGYTLENLSAVNPASVNGNEVKEPTLLQEGDAVQIGSDIFHFTRADPALGGKDGPAFQKEPETPTIYEEGDDLSSLAFHNLEQTRWIIKVVSGPNAGAEFGIAPSVSLVIGKDAKSCDILLQDLSVSKQHARVMSEGNNQVTIEDLSSLNGVYINGQKITQKVELKTQDLVALGTTSFLVIDQEQTRETIVSPASGLESSIKENAEDKEKESVPTSQSAQQRQWKKMVIPTRHLVLAGIFALFVIFALGSVLSLFQAKTVEISSINEEKEIAKLFKRYPEVEYSFTRATGKVFILGHVMTEIDHQELIYHLRTLTFVHSVEDNMIIDELVWENTNALLSKNSKWRGVTLTSIIPGHFVLRGYVQSLEIASKLSEYMNINFPYLDKLDNQVVVENTLEAQIQSTLTENNYENVTFQFVNGELVLAGRVPSNRQQEFTTLLASLKKLKGVRLVKNFVIFSKPTSDIVDLSSKYIITGNSKYGNVSQYVVINGKILSEGDVLDGMKITKLDENVIFLEKDGIKFKINYNRP